MPGCRHAHSINKADVWTKIAAAGEATASLISDAYWLGGLVDLLSGLDDDGLGLSWEGMGAGVLIALLTATGTAYSHTILNTNYQVSHDHDHDHDHDFEHGHDEEAHHHSVNGASTESTSLVHDESSKNNLTLLQKAALVGDFISHTGDIAGPITFVSNIASKNRFPLWGKALVQCGATLFGGFSSVANTRTCKNSMEESNRRLNMHN